MKKISLILVFLFALIESKAQNPKDTVSLQQHEVVSVANPVAFRQISKTVHIITKEQIKKSTANSIDDLLRIYGGADVRSRGAMGVQSDINIRGGGFDQGLIMINGISLNDPQTGHHNLNQAIDLEDIDKIEIFEGAAGRWFGANAFSGGLNILTNQKSDKSLDVSVAGGQYGYLSARMAYSYQINALSNKSSVAIKKSDGYMRNTDFNIINFKHNTSVKLKNGLLNFNIGAMDKGFGANSFYTSKYPDQYEHIRTYFSSASFKTGNRIKFNSNIYWRRNFDRFELFREDNKWYVKQGDVYVMDADTAGFPTPGGLYPYKGHNYHRTDVAGADAAMKFGSLFGKTSVKLSFKTERIISNVLGENMKDTIFISNSDGFYTKSKNRNNINFAVNQLYIKNNFNLSLGMSVFYNDDFGTYLSPGIDLGYFINGNIKIFASSNHAIRLPTFTDLYYQGPTNTANPGLKPETSISTEAGIKLFYDSFNASFSGFYRLGKDIIDWIKYNPDEKWQSANITSLNTYGLSASLNYSFKNKIVNYAGLKYAWMSSGKQNSEIISLYALDFLKHNFNLYVNHDIMKNLSASWSITVQKRNGSYIDYQTSRQTDYKTNTLLNLKVIYEFKNFEFDVSANNLLNKQYYDIGNVLQPGIWIIGGIKYHLSR
ncbi:MAG: TonB-dependent receptor [Chlorobi bacterium]|nr:TonB-dependent receptor [Chlorobiota bacterium]